MPLSHKAIFLTVLGGGVVVAAAVFGLTQLLKQTGELTRTRAFPESGAPSRQLSLEEQRTVEEVADLIQKAVGSDSVSQPQ